MDARVRWLSLFCLLLLSSSGCNQPFDPKGPFEKELVVFSILSNDRDKQYVRVSTNYDVTGFDPSENQVDQSVLGAQVTVTGPSNSYRFNGMLLPRIDTSHYKTPIHAYAASPFRAEHGKTYNLAVTTRDVGIASASVTIPGKAIVSLSPVLFTGWFDSPPPYRQQVRDLFLVLATLSAGCKACVIQMFIDYEVLWGSDWQQKRIEVPMRVLVDTLDMWVGDYPTLERVVANQIGKTYQYLAYLKTLDKVVSDHRDQKVTFHRIVARVVQLEENLYNYYSTANSSSDPVSVRLDMPDYSNIRGGNGVFGAFVVDSLVHYLPDDFGLNIK